MYRLSQVLAVATGGFLLFIGARFVADPDAAEAAYGVALGHGGGYALHYAKGARDVFCGALFLALALRGRWHALGLALALATAIPAVDAVAVYAHHGALTPAVVPHLSAVATCLLAGISLLGGGPRSSRADRPGHEPEEPPVKLLASVADGSPQTVVELSVAPGSSTPPHYHERFRETFAVRAGALEVLVADTWRRLGAGESIAVEPGELHAFRNREAGACVLRVELDPGDRDFERAMLIYAGLAREGRAAASGVPRSPLDLAVFVGLNDTHLRGAGRIGEWVLGAVRGLARLVGRERALLARYAAGA